MSKLETQIGSEIDVTVTFEHSPGEEQTHDCPETDSAILILEVCVDGDESKDIQEDLSDGCLSRLEQECHEKVAADIREAYEESQEER